jgi:hypothetical protein
MSRTKQSPLQTLTPSPPPMEEICRKENGSLQWAEDGILTVCVEPRKKYEDPTIVLHQAKDHLPPPTSDLKQAYVNYFMMVYPGTKVSFWKQMSVDQLRILYENLEIWYNYPNHPTGKQAKRSAFKPFYRVPDGINLQQYVDRKGYPDDTWIEVFHAGHMNTDFFIPSEMFAGTFYYPAKGSGVFLPLGRSLVARNKVEALKKLGVPNDVIGAAGGKAFKRWLLREEKKVAKENPTMTPEEVSRLALDNQIKEMASGKNKTRSGLTQCYYGLGDTGDGLLAKAAIQEGYDTIQLIQEAQLGCDINGVLEGFELIDLRNPKTSAKLLRMAVPESYFKEQKGYY